MVRNATGHIIYGKEQKDLNILAQIIAAMIDRQNVKGVQLSMNTQGSTLIMKLYETVEMKRFWIDHWLNEYFNDSHASVPVDCGKLCFVYDLRTNECGVARCSSQDEFDLKTGVAVAYARLRGEPIPDYI